MGLSPLRKLLYKVPYLVLTHPDGMAAWYDRRYQLQSSSASQELVEYAKKHHTKVSVWEPDSGLELPDWANEMGNVNVYWLFNGSVSLAELKRIPLE